jgi:hypothetical protein
MKRRYLICSLLPFCAQAADGLLGRWRSMTTTRGGIGAVYEFMKGGVVRYSSAAIVEMPFEQDGNQLKMSSQNVGMGWHADGRLQLNFGRNVVEDYVRVGGIADSAEPLLGEWKGRRVMGEREVPVLLQFRATKVMLMVLQLKTYTGRYSGGRMTVSGLPARRVQVRSEGLVEIQVEGGDNHEFTRF